MRAALVIALVLCLAGCAARAGVRSVDAVRASGSLRGTDLDGNWGTWRQGSLQSDTELRRRFAHLLTAVGELDLRELRQWIAREVAREQGPAAVGPVLAVWDEHLAQQQGRPTPNQEAAGNPAPNAPPVRRAPPAPLPRGLLTPELPLNAEQQQALQQQRVQRFGTEAAERLRAEDSARWAWAQRLALARAELQGLGEGARDAALARQFSGSELTRARALLGFPP